VKPFGSFVSGLSLPSSDLDLVICLPKVHREAGPEAAGFLEGRNAIKESWQQNLARCLRAQTWVDVSSIKVITNTAVPVIKFKTRASVSGCVVSLDVSFEGNIHQGLEANRLNVALMSEFPSLRPIVLILKQFLTRRGLCESFTGGLSSYALLLLCARFLQEQPILTPLDLGGTLLGLLNFYGNHLQPAVTGISVARRTYFSRNDLGPSLMPPPSPRTGLPHNIASVPSNGSGSNTGVASNRRHSYNTTPHPHPPSLVDPSSSFASSFKPYKFDPLFIEDPLAFENNVGRNCFRVHQVQKLWSETHSELLQRIYAIERGSSKGCLLDVLVGPESAEM
jgi:DNA polymerase sigma